MTNAWIDGAMSLRGVVGGVAGVVAGSFAGKGLLPKALGAVVGLAAGSYWQQQAAAAQMTQGNLAGLGTIVGGNLGPGPWTQKNRNLMMGNLSNIVGGGTVDGRGGLRR